MKKPARLLLVVVAVVGALLAEHSTVAGGADKGAVPKRVKMDCRAYRAGMEQMSKSMGIKMKITPESWGEILPQLRALPPGAELCGATDAGPVVIVSPLYGKDIAGHYAPLFAKVGCQPFTCEVSGGLSVCTCKGNGVRGRVQTDADIEAFSLLVTGKPGK